MKIKQILIFVFSLSLLTLTFSCKKNKAPADPDKLAAFKDYIAAFPAGEISVTSPIEIRLRHAIKTNDGSYVLPKGVVSLQPKTKGVWALADNRILTFTPEEYLKPSTDYKVKLKLGDLTDVPKELSTFSFDFKTITPNFNVVIAKLQTTEEDAAKQELVGYVRTADYTNAEQLKKILSAKQSKRDLPIVWKDAETSTKYPFVIEDVRRAKEEDSEVVVKWNGKKMGVKSDGDTTFPIPAQNSFSIVQMDVENDPEQILKINFSDPILKNQNFEGLIEIDGLDDHRYVVDGNVLNVYPEERVAGDYQVLINGGVKSENGYALKEGHIENIAFESLKPAIRLVSNGNILPNSSDLKFNFEAVNLKAIDVRVIKMYEENILQFLQENDLDGNSNLRRVGRPIAYKTIQINRADDNYASWRAYSIDLANLFQQDKGALYRIELGFKPTYSTYTCSSFEGLDQVQSETDSWDQPDEDYWNNEYYYDDYYDYDYHNWRERENPCNAAYYGSRQVISTNVLASNVGLMAKRGNNGQLFFVVNDILTSQPVSGASVQVFNYQKEELNALSTDKNGIAKYQESKVPYFAVASHNGQKAYVRLQDGAALNLSKFDVSGDKPQKGLKGYLYGERGVWRPGDSIFMTFVLNDKENPLPKNHPVVFELTDPEGKLIDQQIENNGKDGFYTFLTSTTSDATTGNWQAKVKVGGASFYKAVKVETIKPNRLKINFDFDEEVIKPGSSLAPTLDVKWLHGATAGDLRTTVDANVRAIASPFDRYEDFTFSDPATEFNAEEVRVFDGKLDANGQAKLPNEIDLEDRAPGMLKVTYITKVAENGGGFSIDALSKNYAPFNSFVGIKSPKGTGWGRWLETDTAHDVELVTVNADGKPTGNRKLEVEVYEINWRWWWNSSTENLSSYVSSSSKKPIASKTITSNSSGKATYKLKVDYPNWGRYLVRVKDVNSGHATGEVVYIDWPYWRSSGREKDPEAATMLNFSLDKEKYEAGDDVEINFPSSESGRALVTIENGSRVLDAFWVNPTKERTKAIFKATEEMAPNAYVSITYVQPHLQTENDLPIRLFGILPLTVENKNSILTPKISVADELKPEEKYTVKVSETNGKPMTYTLAVVDEGLLDLTRFKTPNAWGQFFKRQALGVSTWDMYDKVVGAYGGQIDQIFAIGGGDAEEVAGAQKANRFKPVVTYLGPFTLRKNDSKKHSIEMPNYVGSVRVMVVAGNRDAGAYGSVEKAIPVKKPLMVMGALPRKMSPGEKLSLPISVFAMDKKVKNVKVDVATNDFFEITSSSTQDLSFAKTGEQDISFDLVAGDKPGIAKVDIIATGAGERSTYSVELDVVNPNAPASKYTDVELLGNATQILNYQPFGSPGTNTAELQFSILPNMDFNRRLDYLIRYPYGCAEQTTSGAFPQLYLADIIDVNKGKRAQISQNIKWAIQRLSGMQHSNGGMQYWSGSGSVNDWTTSYAGHFLIEAEKKGYALPAGVMNSWKSYQKSAARNWTPTSFNYSSDLAQAYRLYTLALAGDEDLAAMNRLRETPRLNNNAKWRLAAAYAVVGQKRTAERLLKNASNEFKAQDRYHSYGSDLRNRAMALETAVVAGDDKKAVELVEVITERLSGNSWYSTQSTAYSLVALAKFIEKNGGSGLDVKYNLSGQGANNIKSTSVMALRDLEIGQSNAIQFTNNKDNKVYVRLHQRGTPPLGMEEEASRGLSLNIIYKDNDGSVLSVNDIKQGDDFVAEITVKNQKDINVENIALTYVLPSGWEVVNTRFTDAGDSNSPAVDNIDIRDDRVHYFFGLRNSGASKGASKTFKLMLNASYPGTFYLPGARAEAMYDNDFYVSQKGDWITINRE